MTNISINWDTFKRDLKYKSFQDMEEKYVLYARPLGGMGIVLGIEWLMQLHTYATWLMRQIVFNDMFICTGSLLHT